jgi:hypothetical protein
MIFAAASAALLHGMLTFDKRSNMEEIWMREGGRG